LTIPPTKVHFTTTILVTIGASLPELSHTPVLRHPDIAVAVHSTVSKAVGITLDTDSVVMLVKGFANVSGSARHVKVLVAQSVNGVHDAVAGFDLTTDSVALPLRFHLRHDGHSEEEQAEADEKEDGVVEARHFLNADFVFVSW
jgi:hypothetical protein